MYKRLFLSSALMLSACTMDTDTGNMRVTAPLLAGNQWSSEPARNGCAISAGEISVVLRRGQGPQVEVERYNDIGSEYTLLVNGHRYEAMGGRFTARQSHDIVEDFKAGDTVYSEWREFADGRAHQWYWFTNKISLADFAREYRDCAHSPKK